MTKKQRTRTKKTKRAAHRSKKVQYRVSNWSAYNKSLVQRGDVTLWISEEVLAAWTPAPTGVRQRGGQTQYSDQAITCLLTLRAVFRLPYRQTEGLARSIMPLLDTDVIIPDYTTLGKRSATLPVDLPVQATGEPMHIVIDYIRGLAMPVRSAVPHE